MRQAGSCRLASQLVIRSAATVADVAAAAGGIGVIEVGPAGAAKLGAPAPVATIATGR